MADLINPLGASTPRSVNSNTDKALNNTNTSAQSTPESSAASRGSAGDTVSLSQQSQQVSNLTQQLKDSPAIDQARIESIKQEIANGNYPLDPEKTAESLINLEQSLLE